MILNIVKLDNNPKFIIHIMMLFVKIKSKLKVDHVKIKDFKIINLKFVTI